MYRRIWTPHNLTFTKPISTIHFYDSGTVCGTLIDSNWSSWEVISREKDVSGCIHEILKELPQDYVPFHILHSESSPVYEISQDVIVIPEWTLSIQALVQGHPLLEKQALQARAPVEKQKQTLQAPLEKQALQAPLEKQALQARAPLEKQKQTLQVPQQKQMQQHLLPVHHERLTRPYTVDNSYSLNSVEQDFPQPAPRPPPRPSLAQVPPPMLVEALQQPSAKRVNKAKKGSEPRGRGQNQSQKGLVGVALWTPLVKKGVVQQVQLQQSLSQPPLLQNVGVYPASAAAQSLSQASKPHSKLGRKRRQKLPLSVPELTLPSSTNSA